MPHQCTNCDRTFPDGSKEMLSGCPDCGGNKFQFAPGSVAGDASGEPTAAGGDAGSTPTDDVPTTGDPSGTGADPDGVASRAAETVRGWMSSNPTTASAESEPKTAGEHSTTDESRTRTEAQADGLDDADSGDSLDDDESADDGFDEWPETARRPADRSATEQSVADEESAGGARPAERSSGTPEPTAETIAPVESEDSAQASARSEVVRSEELPETDHDDGPITEVGVTDAEPAAPPESGRVVSEPSGEQPSIEDLRAELNEQFESIKIVRPGQYELNLMELYNRDEYIISLQEDGRYVIDVPDSWHEDADE